jgi:hypothetical protein
MDLESCDLDRLLDGLTREVILPLMRRLEQQASHPINTKIIAGLWGRSVRQITGIAASIAGRPAEAEVRALFRASRFPRDIRFRIEAVINGLPGEYTGFHIGWEYLTDDGAKLSLKSEEYVITHRYNTLEWMEDWPFMSSS